VGARFQNFVEFYPFYLSQHSNRTCRRLHFVGSCCALGLLSLALVYQSWMIAAAALASGYLFAWTGHMFFEKNKPATFRHPFYSFLGDWAMFKDMLMGKIEW
jgi:hypothetical protein